MSGRPRFVLTVGGDPERRFLRALLERRLRDDKILSGAMRSTVERWLSELAADDQDGPQAVLNIDGTEHRSTIVERVFARWASAMRKPRARLDAKRRRLIERRLAEGYTEAELLAAIDGCARSDWHMGDNDRGRRYDSLELILRDAEHIEAFGEMATSPPALRATRSDYGAGGRHARSRAALDGFRRRSSEDER